jgi:hypothetical protein
VSAAKPSAGNEIVIFAGSSRRGRTGALRDQPPTARDGNAGGPAAGNDGTPGPEPPVGVPARMRQAPFLTLRDGGTACPALGSPKAGAVSARCSRLGALTASEPAQ